MVYNSGDVVYCTLKKTMIGITLTPDENNHVSSRDCALEKCVHFKSCKISENPLVKKNLNRA